MLRKIGRLDSDAIKELNEILDSIFSYLDKNQKKKAESALLKLTKTPNYFIREFVGRRLSRYSDKRKINPIAKRMIKNKYYGVRAAALFYFYDIYRDNEKKIMGILEEYIDKIPWEVETIINELWRNHPDYMKEKMHSWIDSKNDRMRALSFHGMENIAHSDANYIMQFVRKAIDDNVLEVQKKITHILTQAARANPSIVFPYIRQWLADADDRRMKTIWIAMKKIANIVKQRNGRGYDEEFVILTEQTVEDWKQDENERVAEMGDKLSYIVHKGYKKRY